MILHTISEHQDAKDSTGWKKAPCYPLSFASKHKNLPDLLYGYSYRSSLKEDHVQEVPSLDQVLKEIDFNGLLHCGKKETQSDSGHSALPTQNGKCETPEAQREQFVHCRDQNKDIYYFTASSTMTQRDASSRYSK